MVEISTWKTYQSGIDETVSACMQEKSPCLGNGFLIESPRISNRKLVKAEVFTIL